jgi:hypothetical protein
MSLIDYSRDFYVQPFNGNKTDFPLYMTWLETQSLLTNCSDGYTRTQMPDGYPPSRPIVPPLNPHPTAEQSRIYTGEIQKQKDWDVTAAPLISSADRFRMIVYKSTDRSVRLLLSHINALRVNGVPLTPMVKNNMEFAILIENYMPDIQTFAQDVLQEASHSTDRHGYLLHYNTYTTIVSTITNLCILIDVPLNTVYHDSLFKSKFLKGITAEHMRGLATSLNSQPAKTLAMCMAELYAIDASHTNRTSTATQSTQYPVTHAYNVTVNDNSRQSALSSGLAPLDANGNHYGVEHRPHHDLGVYNANVYNKCNNCHLIGHYVKDCLYITCNNCFHLYHRDDPRGHRTDSCPYRTRFRPDMRITIPFRNDTTADNRNDRGNDTTYRRGSSRDRDTRDRSRDRDTRDRSRDRGSRGHSPDHNDRGRSNSPARNGRSATPGPSDSLTEEEEIAAIRAKFRKRN